MAVLWEVVLLIAIVHVPVFHEPFGTFSLNAWEWSIAVLSAATVVPVLELAKWMERRGWFGKLR
jgi:Ca2+-transporting ATPase